MKKMIRLSLTANILVLIPVCWGLFFNSAWVANGFGEPTPARGILLSIYGAILLVSVGFLFKAEAIAVASLLLVQVLYKITTPLSVGTFDNPVVISNLVIAALHVVTLGMIFRDTHSRWRHPNASADSVSR